ncbi:hypothetical protein [Compostibacter hankyongensis]|uniref:Uncharacterized protein n=1 Tax=Compostibacter hankyongensis TaxID=1007089 RepID=A0ABP8FFI1_9BACT
MNNPRLRNILLLVAFLILIGGTVLKMREHPAAWYLIGFSIALYIFARFFMRRA